MADLSHIPVLVPDHVTDASTLLPMSLLDSASNHLGCDLVDAVRGAVPGKRYAAWAELAYQLARHTGVEKASRETYRNYTIEEIQHALGWDREEEPADPTPPTGPKSGDSSAGSSESP
jgi:hypothetical protein